MGYTHYWYRKVDIQKDVFARIVGDFKQLLEPLQAAGVKLGDGAGVANPILEDELAIFNGLVNCGHEINEAISIPWPAPNAGGVNATNDPVAGGWAAGSMLRTRTCDGDCSYETFYFPRVYEPEKWERKDSEGRYFQFCKTAYRPYDLAVTAFLVIAKIHLQEEIIIRSDGTLNDWFDAKLLCQMHLGYGQDVNLFGEQKGERA